MFDDLATPQGLLPFHGFDAAELLAQFEGAILGALVGTGSPSLLLRGLGLLLANLVDEVVAHRSGFLKVTYAETLRDLLAEGLAGERVRPSDEDRRGDHTEPPHGGGSPGCLRYSRLALMPSSLSIRSIHDEQSINWI
jgi:hypothetical protein